ncbi:Coatomer/clathrin adaptor appendage, Ig-like subdomain-containing protein [Entophlyctis helioformis]|nr:Coatomer/clathrin adaptor appendage, Ig-like subdomain-containing protein [Entophlyctis helioformis]
MDLLGGIGLGGPVSSGSGAAAQSKPADLLGDLFGGGGGGIGVSTSSAAPAVDPLAGLFGGSSAVSPLSVSASAPKTYTCYNKHGLVITLAPTRDSPTSIVILSTFTNTGGVGVVTNLSFQVAVPKSLKLAMQPASSSTVEIGQSATQSMRIENPTKAVVRLRLKVVFAVSGQPVDEIVEFSSFDASLFA